MSPVNISLSSVPVLCDHYRGQFSSDNRLQIQTNGLVASAPRSRVGASLPLTQAVWQFLLFAEKDALKRRQFQSLAIPIGLILTAVWRHHWQCEIDGDSWSVETCLSIVRTQRFDLGLNFQDFDCIV
jgi:hypothetical protein